MKNESIEKAVISVIKDILKVPVTIEDEMYVIMKFKNWM